MSWGGYIAGQIRGAFDAHEGLGKQVCKAFAGIVVVAVLLEVFLFNANYFLTIGYDEVPLTRLVDVKRGSDGLYTLSEANHTFTFPQLDAEVNNIHIDFDDEQPAQLLEVSFRFTDDAHATYFGTTDYTAGVPIAKVSTAVEESEYIHVNAAGKVHALEIELVGSPSYPVKLADISINAPEPFAFNGARFAVVLVVLALLWALRPRSRIYRIGIVEEQRLARRVIVAVAIAEALIVSSYLFMGSNLVGVASKNYNYGSWDHASIVNVYDVAGDNAQQYAMLAEAFAKGQLHLDAEPPEWLAEMDDPYDKGARDEMQKAHGGEYLFDAAYRDGHYYVYFGVVPVLVFYLPFYLATGQSFPTAIGVLVALLAFLAGCTALLHRFACYHFRRMNLGVFLLLQIPLVMCAGVLYLAKFPTFYSLPIMCGLAFSVWGLYFWMRGRASERPQGWYLAGSACMALVVGCRPQLVVLSLVAFPLFWRHYISARRVASARGAAEVACLLAPYAVVVGGVMWYNAARFGSPFDFGANYNLTVNDMTRRGFELGRLAPALFAFFLQPPNCAGTFPFLLPCVFDTTYMGQTVREVTFGGIFACLPVLWILPFASILLKRRFEQRATNTVAGVVIVLLVSGVIVALADAEMAGILQRYYADFSFMFLAAAVLLAFIANENMKPGSSLERLFRICLPVLVACSVVYISLLCFVPEIGWFSDVYDWAYQGIVESFSFWT